MIETPNHCVADTDRHGGGSALSSSHSSLYESLSPVAWGLETGFVCLLWLPAEDILSPGGWPSCSSVCAVVGAPRFEKLLAFLSVNPCQFLPPEVLALNCPFFSSLPFGHVKVVVCSSRPSIFFFLQLLVLSCLPCLLWFYAIYGGSGVVRTDSQDRWN